MSEIETVTIRCKQCGSGHIVKVDSEHFNIGRCPSCGNPYGELAQDALYSLRKSREAMTKAKDYIDMEFDIIEK
jgi:Zn finger protein HypA/HybF involved in hydrogenase expression